MTTTTMPLSQATDSTRRPETELRFYLTVSVIGTVVVLGGLGLWLATARLVAATIVPGNLVVASDVKKVQHQFGGTIAELRVHEGDRVAAGDLLVRLDDTVARANLDVASQQRDEALVHQSRLLAERDGKPDLILPQSLRDRIGTPTMAALIEGERNLFLSRRAARDGQRTQLRQRITELNEEVSGYRVQQAATQRQLQLSKDELAGVKSLYDKGLVAVTRLTALQRETARLEGELGHLIATAAQTNGKITELDLQIAQIDIDLRTETAKDLRDVESKLAELGERLVTTADALDHMDIRSPETGTVNQLSIHTVRGVISPGEQLMTIVPRDDGLVVEAHLPAGEIDQVHVGQTASVKFTAFNARTTPELNGRVTRVSADLVRDQANSAGYYVVRAALSGTELEKLADQKPVAGMPVELHINGAERTALDYLVKPLMDQFQRAFRER